MSQPWRDWAAARHAPWVVHLDSAAAGRPSRATLEAVAAHQRLETEVGAYVAQDQAADVLQGLRADVAGLLGMPVDGVAFRHSASDSLEALLASWPLRAGARVGTLRVEWGPNLEAFAWHGLTQVELPDDDAGRLELDAFATRLRTDPPDLVHLTQVTSHRGLVQPVAAAAALCRAAGIPLWVDAAQAVGHVDTATGADAIYATSRKWLTGPRGVGFLAVRDAHWDALRVSPGALLGDVSPVARLESDEAHIAGRLGLANAVREHLAADPARVRERLAELGQIGRERLAGLSGWEVVSVDSAITALRPVNGQDVFDTRARLLDEAILVTACGIVRAPKDTVGPLLRVSPHVDSPENAFDRLGAALATIT